MKLSLQQIKEIKRNTNNKLTKKVCNYVIDKWHDYDDKTNIFMDVLSYGCQSGIVSELIYYNDTMTFYKRYKEEINELLSDYMNSCGIYDFKCLFRNKWDEEDPLITDCTNQNLLAWFGFEETLRNIGLNFKSLQEYI